MFRFFILGFIVTGKVLASGCDSSYFQSINDDSQESIMKDFGILSPDEANVLIEDMARVHRVGLFYFRAPPVVKEQVSVKLVSTIYSSLDTDCGWSHFGSVLTIKHLKIGDSYFPDIFRDIYAEYRGEDNFIQIKKADLKEVSSDSLHPDEVIQVDVIK